MLDVPVGADGLVLWHSLFHLKQDDQRLVLEHLLPCISHAVLMTTGPEASEVCSSFAGERFYHASLDPEEYQALLLRHGFDRVRFQPRDPACGDASVWLAQRS